MQLGRFAEAQAELERKSREEALAQARLEANAEREEAPGPVTRGGPSANLTEAERDRLFREFQQWQQQPKR